MTVQIGRVLGLPEPMVWQQSGDSVTIRGTVKGAAVGNILIARDQILGYNGNLDEPVIPIVSTTESRLTGFYRVTSVNWDTTPAMLAKFRGEYQLQAERIRAFRTPQIESFLTGALMVNNPGVTTAAEPFHAYPLAAFEYNNSVVGYGISARPVADGTTTVNWVRMNTTGAAPIYKGLARWSTDPSHYYDAACQITSNDPVTHVVVGHQEPAAYGWQLQNGLVYVNFGSQDRLNVGWADSSHTYFNMSGAVYLLGLGSGSFYSYIIGGAAPNAKIIRNAPEECIVRFPILPQSSVATTPAYMDVAIRRGSRVIRVYVAMATYDTLQVGFTPNVACTALTGGLVWTANNGSGHRLALMSAAAVTKDLVNGRLQTTAGVNTFDFGIVGELGGSSSTYPNRAQDQINQYYAAQVERMQVVGR